MNKKLLLILPLLALSLGGCNSSEDIDDEDVISYPPGVVPSDPAQPTGNGGNGDHTTQDEDIGAEVTGIDSVVSSPAKFDVVEGIEIADITLKLSLSNGGSINRHPTSINYDASGASKGDAVSITAYYDSFSTTFNSEVDVWHDEISPSTPGNPKPTGSSYVHWTYNSSDTEAKYDLNTKGSTYVELGTSAGANGMPGIVSTYSGGRVKEIRLEWDASTTNTSKLYVFGSSIPFDSAEDVRSLTQASSAVTMSKGSESYTFDKADYYYLGFKAATANAKLTKITIIWDVEADIPTLESMEYGTGSRVFSETGQTAWDYSNVTVTGTYSDGASGDITKFINFSSDTAVPAEPIEEMDVSVTATYKRDTDVTYTSTLKGKVTIGFSTVASWSYGGSNVGGTLTKNLDNNAANSCFIENNSASEFYIQIKQSSAYWSLTPTKIKISAIIGSGNKLGDLPAGKEIRVVLVDTSGNTIGNEYILTNKMPTKDFTEYSIEVDGVDGVAGFKILHAKIDKQNVRYRSAQLRFR